MAAAPVVRWAAGGSVRQGTLSDLDEALTSPTTWIDVSEPDRDTLSALASRFGLHPLAVEDVLHDDQRPKTESYEGHVFFVWLVPSVQDAATVRGVELDVFLGKGWLITVHREHVEAIEKAGCDDSCVSERGPEWTLHAILDRAVDEIFPLVDAAGDRLDEMGDALLEHVDKQALPELHAIKRRLLQLHKVLGPERDALRELSREEAYVSPEAYRYFQDIQDHLARIEDRVDTYRDVAASVMDVYLSAVSNRLNETMKRLTVVATIFMPGTLVASIFGMNLGFPLRDTYLGMAVALSLIAGASLGMYMDFRRRQWW